MFSITLFPPLGVLASLSPKTTQWPGEKLWRDFFSQTQFNLRSRRTVSSLSVRGDKHLFVFWSLTPLYSGFDFSSTGFITLKAYYIPAPKSPLGTKNINSRQRPIHLWDTDWARLRILMPQLHPSLVAPLDRLISFVDDLDGPYKPRIQIFAVDCVASSVNRLKVK